ncbi:MAG TPA: hypothetical protein VNN73_20330 [Blastocatellia bacterium]|nr:hypothetical protein [Blastocatellia bacterium]
MSFKSTAKQALNRRGIDARQFKTLLLVYLKQDLRGGKAFQQFSAGEYIRSNFALLSIVAMYLFFGLMIGAMVFTTDLDVFHYSVFTLTFTLFIVALAILSESGNVIFNEAETDVLGHLPISPRTHFAAKAMNLFLFTLLLSAAANLFPALAGILAGGSNPLFVLGHAVAASLVALMATAIVVVSYGLLMRHVSRERFDGIITFSQIALVLVFTFGFQILPRVFGDNRMPFAPGFHWYYLLYPPAWFSGVAMILIGKIEPGTLALAALATLSLIALSAIALRKVATGYSMFVSHLSYQEGKPADCEEQKAAKETIEREGGLLHGIEAMFLRAPAERAVFELVTVYLRRNREIKVRLYPSLAYFILFPLIAIFTDGLPDPFASLQRGGRASGGVFYSLMGAAMICFVSLTAIEGLVFSEQHAAAYIYRVAPIKSLGEVHSGLRKAIMLWLALPGYVALIALYSILWRNPVHALLVIGPWTLMTPAVLMVPFLFREVLPLSRKYQKGQQTARNVWIFVCSIVVLSFVGVFQVVAIKGRIPPLDLSIPYWLFITIIAALSATLYVAFKNLGGERKPIPPS